MGNIQWSHENLRTNVPNFMKELSYKGVTFGCVNCGAPLAYSEEIIDVIGGLVSANYNEHTQVICPEVQLNTREGVCYQNVKCKSCWKKIGRCYYDSEMASVYSDNHQSSATVVQLIYWRRLKYFDYDYNHMVIMGSPQDILESIELGKFFDEWKEQTAVRKNDRSSNTGSNIINQSPMDLSQSSPMPSNPQMELEVDANVTVGQVVPRNDETPCKNKCEVEVIEPTFLSATNVLNKPLYIPHDDDLDQQKLRKDVLIDVEGDVEQEKKCDDKDEIPSQDRRLILRDVPALPPYANHGQPLDPCLDGIDLIQAGDDDRYSARNCSAKDEEANRDDEEIAGGSLRESEGERSGGGEVSRCCPEGVENPTVLDSTNTTNSEVPAAPSSTQTDYCNQVDKGIHDNKEITTKKKKRKNGNKKATT